MTQNPFEPPKSLINDQPRRVTLNLDPTPAGRHILEAVKHVEDLRACNRLGGEMHFTANELCIAVLDLAFDRTKFDETGFTAVLYLEKLGITSSEYIGRAIYELVELGGMTTSPTDSQDDFTGLFDRAVPMREWSIGWKPKIAKGTSS